MLAAPTKHTTMPPHGDQFLPAAQSPNQAKINDNQKRQRLAGPHCDTPRETRRAVVAVAVKSFAANNW